MTKQRAFNKAMINKDTQCIFIDEACVSTMDVDDWKLLTQGGWTAIDTKYSTALGFVNRCPMIIACQEEMQFPEADREAMDSRLNKYVFKPLPTKDPSAYAWLKNHPIDVILWAMEMADQPCITPQSNDDAQGLSKEEKAALLSCELDDSQDTAEDVDQVDEEEQPVPGPLAEALRMAQQNYDANSIQYQIVTERLSNVEAWTRESIARAEIQWQERVDGLVHRGVPIDVAKLLPKYGQPVPETVLRHIRRVDEQDAREQALQREVQAKEAFDNAWVKKMEFELSNMTKRLEVVARSEIPDLKSYIEILVYKLKMHHENAGNLKCATIVEERRKACIEWGLIEQKHAYLVTSAFEPLPLCETEDEEDPEKDDELGKPPGICCVSQTIFFQPVLCY